MSIAHEPDVHTDVFWERVLAADTAERVYGPPMHRARPVLVITPGAPCVLYLADGRQFIGSSKRELLERLEAS